MASSLSEDEFHRMQLQLLELRTANYELDSKGKKQEREIGSMKETAEVLEKELQKSQKAIGKSKKAKEVELLLQENDGLQRKLHSQEEEFRLQNATLMQELTSYVSTNEALETQIKELKETKGDAVLDTSKSSAVSQLEDEIRRLQAQNKALQKSLSDCQEKLERRHRRSESGGMEGDLTEHSSLSDMNTQHTLEPGYQEEDLSNLSETEKIEMLEKSIEEFKLNLNTELEEKRMLKQELQEKETHNSTQIAELQEEVSKLTDKLKKKQESFLNLQEEKEGMYKELSKKLEDLQASKDRDHKYYTDQIGRLQSEIQKYKQEQAEMKSSSGQTVKQLEEKMAAMQQQIDAANISGHQHVQEQTQKYQTQIQEKQTRVLVLTQQNDDLSVQHKESQKACQEAQDQMFAIQQDRDKQIQALQEANKVAEKRKTLLDELAISYQKDCDKNREQLLNMEDKFEADVKLMKQKLEDEKKKNSELEKLKPVVEDLQTKFASLEESKGWLERRLTETEGSLDKTLDENETKTAAMMSEHEMEVESLQEKYKKELSELQTSFDSHLLECKERETTQVKKIEELEDMNKRTKQEVKDSVDDKRLHEKKGKSMLKDLKKQLHAEKKRTEKLQERMQEILSDTRHSKSMEELFNNPKHNDSWQEDRSSVSSWSASASGAGTFTSFNSSAMSGSPTSPLVEDRTLRTEETQQLEQEHQDLLSRLTKVQEEKWSLEEKVRHLETSTAAMADDLLEKSKIIQHYVRETRTDTKPHQPVNDDKMTLKKVLDLVNKGEDQNLREMNKKLQNMLEETLTKNMHLESNLLMLSEEIVQMKKSAETSDSTSKKPAAETNSLNGVASSSPPTTVTSSGS